MYTSLKKYLAHFQFGRSKQLAFLEDLSALVDDGVSVTQAIDTIYRINEGIPKTVAHEVLQGIAAGKLLADSMAPWFPYSIIEVIRAGELGGTLSKALQATAGAFAERVNVIGILVKALLYPIVVFLLALIVIVFIKNYALITFAAVKPVSSWPLIGRELFQLALMTERWWWFFMLMSLCAIFLLVRLLHSFIGPSRKLIDQFPLLELYREMTAARFMQTLGLLIANGVVLKKALATMYQQASPYLAWHLLQMEYRLSYGQDNIADVLDTDLLNKNDIIRLKVISQVKGFADALSSLGKKANRRSRQRIEMTSRFLAVILLVASALLAGLIVLGIYSIGSALAT